MGEEKHQQGHTDETDETNGGYPFWTSVFIRPICPIRVLFLSRMRAHCTTKRSGLLHTRSSFW